MSSFYGKHHCLLRNMAYMTLKTVKILHSGGNRNVLSGKKHQNEAIL